jgi:hypothetical protein
MEQQSFRVQQRIVERGEGRVDVYTTIYMGFDATRREAKVEEGYK